MLILDALRQYTYDVTLTSGDVWLGIYWRDVGPWSQRSVQAQVRGQARRMSYS